ncbi:hypothetical protein J8657_01370 [Dickeya oryzae]|uniref:Uncharacterized protein n=1 Tax=Dickeya oryzae TaxID=1240404 RepID=A0ABS5B800_9GAMM|nr:hypothetical protein [Dickeya oryzae]MBP2856247.1 hypothetical protein [Dickeya oryzae]
MVLVEETESFRSVIDVSAPTLVQRVSGAPHWVFPTLNFNTEQYPKQRTIQSIWENQNQPFDIKQGRIFISLLRIVPKRLFFYQCDATSACATNATVAESTIKNSMEKTVLPVTNSYLEDTRYKKSRSYKE